MRRGFTLIEAMISLAIASIVIATTTGAVMNINKQISDTNRRGELQDEGKRVEEFIISRAQGAGGGQVRPHSSVLVEDGQQTANTVPQSCHDVGGAPGISCTGETNDRLVLFTPVAGFPQCPVTGTTGANLNVGNDTSGVCCYNTPAAASWEDRQMLLIGANGVATSIFVHNTTGGCKINVPPGQQGQGSKVLPQTLAATPFPATLVAVTVETYFVNAATHSLMKWLDADGDGLASTAELMTIDDRIFGWQLALGYDGNPADGAVVDNVNTTDEWLFNAASDPLPGTAATSFANIQINQLRMLQVNLAVGTGSELRGGNTVSMLNGPVISTSTTPATFLITTNSKAFLRNLDLFTQ